VPADLPPDLRNLLGLDREAAAAAAPEPPTCVRLGCTAVAFLHYDRFTPGSGLCDVHGAEWARGMPAGIAAADEEAAAAREVIRLSAEVERLAKQLEETEAALALLAEPATPEEDRAVAAALRPRFGGPMLLAPTDPGRCVVCDGALEGPVTALGSRPLGRHERLRDHCPAHGEIVEMNAAKAAKDAAKGNHHG
jgi:hypothetical protein